MQYAVFFFVVGENGLDNPKMAVVVIGTSSAFSVVDELLIFVEREFVRDTLSFLHSNKGIPLLVADRQ